MILALCAIVGLMALRLLLDVAVLLEVRDPDFWGVIRRRIYSAPRTGPVILEGRTNEASPEVLPEDSEIELQSRTTNTRTWDET